MYVKGVKSIHKSRRVEVVVSKPKLDQNYKGFLAKFF